MHQIHIFADEAGDLVCEPGNSRYFIIATAMTGGDTTIGDQMLQLRREVARFDPDFETFHASNDPAPRRRRVYELIAQSSVRIDATILDKRKAQPKYRASQLSLYKLALYLHIKYLLDYIVSPGNGLYVAVSSLQLAEGKQVVRNEVNDVVEQCAKTTNRIVTFVRNSSDPCLQVADYGAWAVQRKFESGDRAPFDMIADRVKSQFQAWKGGRTLYYYYYYYYYDDAA